MQSGKFIQWLTTLCFSCFISIANAKSNDQEAFFNKLSQLCGKQYVGATIFPAVVDDPFFGKILTAKFSSCTDTEIRIPFQVGDDTSRTWVITKTEQGLQLKHDHRHADGTPDSQTNYGGMANQKGSSYMQYFEADSETAKLIPAAASNVWKIQISEDTQSITYYLERNAKRRFWAVLAVTL